MNLRCCQLFFISFSEIFATVGASKIGVRVSGGDLDEVEAPTEAAAEKRVAPNKRTFFRKTRFVGQSAMLAITVTLNPKIYRFFNF